MDVVSCGLALTHSLGNVAHLAARLSIQTRPWNTAELASLKMTSLAWVLPTDMNRYHSQAETIQWGGTSCWTEGDTEAQAEWPILGCAAEPAQNPFSSAWPRRHQAPRIHAALFWWLAQPSGGSGYPSCVPSPPKMWRLTGASWQCLSGC